LNNTVKKWLIFLLLCTVWGSSFVLMKLGMYGNGNQLLLNPFQVAALRIFSASVILVPFFIKAFKRIPRRAWGYIFLSGLFGNFIPAFLFCIAETKIDSAFTAMLNTLTPISALLIGLIIYRSVVSKNQWLGVIIGFAGCYILFSGDNSFVPGEWGYALMVILATICYGINVNMVRNKLASVGSLDIASGAFATLLVPSLLVLFFTGFYKLPFASVPYIIAISATSVLGILGTALATVVFYKLVKLAGPVFASMVTYGIPFIAIVWGLMYGETINGFQVLGLIIILTGVYLAGRPSKIMAGVETRTEKIPELKQK
jgi:drug/metabolite transporter (DMT)-like permease